MQETAFSPAARQHTVTFPTWKCGRYTRRSATAWPLATVKIWDATTNQMRRCISPDQIEAYFIRSVPLLRVIARVDALIHPRIIYIPEYLRRTCSWFRGPWSQRRKLFTVRYQCLKNCWYNFLRKMKTNWEVEMNQYTESQPNRGAIQRNNETLEAKTVLCMGCLACLEGWLGCLEKRTTRRKWKDVLENLSI